MKKINLKKRKQNKFFSFLWGKLYYIYIAFLIILVGYCAYLSYNDKPVADNVVYSINMNADGSLNVTETWDLSGNEEPVFSFTRNKWEMLHSLQVKFSGINFTDVVVNGKSIPYGVSSDSSYYSLTDYLEEVADKEEDSPTYKCYSCSINSVEAIKTCSIKYTLKDVINGYEDGRYVFNFKLNDGKPCKIEDYSIEIENKGYSFEVVKYNPLFMSDGELFIFVSASDDIKTNAVLTKWWRAYSCNPFGNLFGTLLYVIIIALGLVVFGGIIPVMLETVWLKLFKKEIPTQLLSIISTIGLILFVFIGFSVFIVCIFIK